MTCMPLRVSTHHYLGALRPEYFIRNHTTMTSPVSAPILDGEQSTAVQQCAEPAPVRYVHIRRRNNGIPLDCGGCTLAVKRRQDGQFSVAVAKCPDTKKFTFKAGKGAAFAALQRGKYLVVDAEGLLDIVTKINDKNSQGSLRVTVDLRHIVSVAG